MTKEDFEEELNELEYNLQDAEEDGDMKLAEEIQGDIDSLITEYQNELKE